MRSLVSAIALSTAILTAPNAFAQSTDASGTVTSSWPGEGGCGKFTMSSGSAMGLPFEAINTNTLAGLAMWEKILQAEMLAKVGIPMKLDITVGPNSVSCNDGANPQLAVTAVSEKN